jgi:hypothetical protein
MCEISELIFEANKEFYKKNIEAGLKIYDNPNYKIEKIYEANKLVGFFTAIELEGIIYLEEGHYLGKNPVNFLKMWKKIFDRKKVYRTIILKVNEKMCNFYKKLKFKIIKEDNMYCYFEWRR